MVLNNKEIDESPTKKVQWERMFPHELEEAIQAFSLAWFTYGLCEPHGPHNALGLDSLKAHSLAVLAAKKVGGIVAPPDYWHIHEVGRFAVGSGPKIGETRSWLTAVPPWIHFRNVLYHIRAADALGFKATVLMTGHGGPQMKDFKNLIEYWQPSFSTKLLGIIDFEALEDGKGDHAGFVETSQLWYLEPDCVDIKQLPKTPQPHPNFATGADAHNASQNAGKQMVEYQVNKLCDMAKSLMNSKVNNSKSCQPVSFTEIDEIWQRTIEEIFPTMEIMKEIVDGWQSPPLDSQWRLNWKMQLPKN